MAIFCIIIIILITLYFKKADSLYNKNVNTVKAKTSTLAGIIIFSLWVGLRYNPGIDEDFMNYWDVARYGAKFYEYHRFEFIPQRIADIVQLFHLHPSWFMILMGLALISFTVFAALRLSKAYIAYVFIGFILLYLKFDMNGLRQGVAMSIFLCAITYIKEKNWKCFLLFMLIAFGFHRSAIIWTPVYFLTYLNWEQHNKGILITLIICIVAVMSSLLWLIQHFTFIFEIMNMERKVSNGNVDFIEYESVSSGIGVFLNYTRWLFLLLFIPKVARLSEDKGLYIYMGIFIMGAVLYTFGKEYLYISRVALYPQIAEIILYPYLFDFSKKHLIKNILLRPMLIIQVIAFTYAIGDYFSDWRFIGIHI